MTGENSARIDIIIPIVKGYILLAVKSKNKPAAQAAGADPS